jgi:shikimate dehydrogenase
MNPDGRTQTFAVLGHPVAHSLSPAMHNASLRALGMNAIYLAFDVAEEHVATALQGMLRMGFGGTNITIPLKHAAYRAVAHLAPCARRLGVVNTVAYADGETTGYNTDGVGLLADLRERFDVHPRGLRTLVVGCGGAGRAVALTLAAEGAVRVALANRTSDRARTLAVDLRKDSPSAVVAVLPTEPDAWATAAREADLIVHCTSSGMHRDDMPLLPASAFRRDQCVYDLVYTQPTTPILRAAASAGARTANGLGMLLHQGAASFRIWTGRDADLAAMRSALEAALDQRFRIVPQP